MLPTKQCDYRFSFVSTRALEGKMPNNALRSLFSVITYTFPHCILRESFRGSVTLGGFWLAEIKAGLALPFCFLLRPLEDLLSVFVLLCRVFGNVRMLLLAQCSSKWCKAIPFLVLKCRPVFRESFFESLKRVGILLQNPNTAKSVSWCLTSLTQKIHQSWRNQRDVFLVYLLPKIYLATAEGALQLILAHQSW